MLSLITEIRRGGGGRGTPHRWRPIQCVHLAADSGQGPATPRPNLLDQMRRSNYHKFAYAELWLPETLAVTGAHLHFAYLKIERFIRHNNFFVWVLNFPKMEIKTRQQQQQQQQKKEIKSQ